MMKPNFHAGLTKVLLAAALALGLLARAHAGEVLKFTFGTPTSVTRAGFTKVTAKDRFTPEKGFGLESTDGLLAYDRGGWEIMRPKDEYTVGVYGADRRHDPADSANRPTAGRRYAGSV